MMRHSLLLLFIFIGFSEAGCPRAIFELFNGTIRAAYNFIDSPVGNIGSSETCPYSGRPYVYLPCYPNSTWGYHEPYFSSCSKLEQSMKIFTSTYKPNPYVNLDIDEVSKLPMTNTEEINHVYDYLNDQRRIFQSSKEIASAVTILDRMSRVNNPLPIYPIVDKILSKSSTDSLHQAQSTNRSLVKLFSSLETFSQYFPTRELDQSFTYEHLSVSIINIPTHRPKPIVGFAFDSKTNQTYPLSSNETRHQSTSIQLDSHALLHQNRLAFSVYDHRQGLFDDSTHHVLTRILSLTIDQPQYTTHLRSFVKMKFFIRNQFEKKQTKIQCAFWQIFDNQTARWSTDGCQLIDYDEEYVRCQCDHLTHFAILMEVTQIETPKAVDQILTLMTLIGLSLSSLGLCLTILTFLIFKKLRRHFSQKSLLLLSINLLIVNLVFLITQLYPWSNSSCILLASLLHYFLLSTFSWMFIMALIQYLLFVRVFPTTISAFTIKAAAFAQSLPLIPVCTVLILNPENYQRRSDGFCWLTSYSLWIAFLSPQIIYILINSILFTLVARALLCRAQFQTTISNENNRTESQRFSRFILTLSCFVVLGLSWIFGIFTFGPLRIIFQIAFCLCASLTGFFIFALYIVTSKAKRTCWSNAMKSLAISSIYSPTLSTSSVLTGHHKDLSTTTTTTDHLKSSSSSNYRPTRHLIDGYMPSSPPAPAPPFSIDHEHSHIWSPQTNYIYETYPSSIDDYSFFYASNHDATKL